MLLYPDISNFTFQNVKILKCKIFLINFLDELGNFKQKKITLQNVNFFYILKQQTHWLFNTTSSCFRDYMVYNFSPSTLLPLQPQSNVCSSLARVVLYAFLTKVAVQIWTMVDVLCQNITKCKVKQKNHSRLRYY